MKQIKRNWIELWWKMANGSQTEFERIKATPIVDFYTLYDLWLDGIKEKNKAASAKQR